MAFPKGSPWKRTQRICQALHVSCQLAQKETAVQSSARAVCYCVCFILFFFPFGLQLLFLIPLLLGQEAPVRNKCGVEELCSFAWGYAGGGWCDRWCDGVFNPGCQMFRLMTAYQMDHLSSLVLKGGICSVWFWAGVSWNHCSPLRLVCKSVDFIFLSPVFPSSAVPRAALDPGPCFCASLATLIVLKSRWAGPLLRFCFAPLCSGPVPPRHWEEGAWRLWFSCEQMDVETAMPLTEQPSSCRCAWPRFFHASRKRDLAPTQEK